MQIKKDYDCDTQFIGFLLYAFAPAHHAACVRFVYTDVLLGVLSNHTPGAEQQRHLQRQKVYHVASHNVFGGSRRSYQSSRTVALAI